MDIQKIIAISLIAALILPVTSFGSPSHESNKRIMQNQTQGSHLLLALRSSKPIPNPEEDQIITDSIKKHINKSVILSRFDIDVKTKRGIVTLRGNVDSNTQASRLIELAQSIIGVRDVRSQLTVKRSHQVVRDTVITAKVKGLFVREGIFGPKRSIPLFINVETRNGVVYLYGRITNKAKIDRVIQIVRQIHGVRGVEYKFTKYVPYGKESHKELYKKEYSHE